MVRFSDFALSSPGRPRTSTRKAPIVPIVIVPIAPISIPTSLVWVQDLRSYSWTLPPRGGPHKFPLTLDGAPASTRDAAPTPSTLLSKRDASRPLAACKTLATLDPAFSVCSGVSRRCGDRDGLQGCGASLHITTTPYPRAGCIQVPCRAAECTVKRRAIAAAARMARRR